MINWKILRFAKPKEEEKKIKKTSWGNSEIKIDEMSEAANETISWIMCFFLPGATFLDFSRTLRASRTNTHWRKVYSSGVYSASNRYTFSRGPQYCFQMSSQIFTILLEPVVSKSWALTTSRQRRISFLSLKESFLNDD